MQLRNIANETLFANVYSRLRVVCLILHVYAADLVDVTVRALPPWILTS